MTKDGSSDLIVVSIVNIKITTADENKMAPGSMKLNRLYNENTHWSPIKLGLEISSVWKPLNIVTTIIVVDSAKLATSKNPKDWAKMIHIMGAVIAYSSHLNGFIFRDMNML